MERRIARANVERFRKLLATEQDETKRATILRLLEQEEAKLAEALPVPRPDGDAEDGVN